MDEFELSVDLQASPQEVYRMWLDSDGHAALIGGAAEVGSGVGESFSIWDGYITGHTLALDPPRRIVQAWRTSEFPQGAPDSRLEVRLEQAPVGCRMVLSHSEIPQGQGPQYEAGWKEHYFGPMQEYFSRRGATG
jgi:uncharacterized protein YndB with AHSA1/START domain